MQKKENPLTTWSPPQRSVTPPPHVIMIPPTPTTPASLGVAEIDRNAKAILLGRNTRSMAAHKAWETRKGKGGK